MPNEVKDAKIALISVDITLPEFAQQLQIQVSDNTAVQEFIESRKLQLKEIAEVILSSGANVVLCKRDIDPFVAEIFAQKGVYACRRVAMSDMEAISRAGEGRMIVSGVMLSESHSTSRAWIATNSARSPRIAASKSASDSSTFSS